MLCLEPFETVFILDKVVVPYNYCVKKDFVSHEATLNNRFYYKIVTGNTSNIFKEFALITVNISFKSLSEVPESGSLCNEHASI